MPITQEEYEVIMGDESKVIVVDISWREDEDHSPAVEFRAEIASGPGYPVFVRGSYNPLVPALSFAIIHRNVGRIYGLDLGKAHHNPSCERVGETHKHRWTETYGDKHAYEPADITTGAEDPVCVWEQFCTEARLKHEGTLAPPPPYQEEIEL